MASVKNFMKDSKYHVYSYGEMNAMANAASDLAWKIREKSHGKTRDLAIEIHDKCLKLGSMLYEDLNAGIR